MLSILQLLNLIHLLLFNPTLLYSIKFLLTSLLSIQNNILSSLLLYEYEFNLLIGIIQSFQLFVHIHILILIHHNSFHYQSSQHILSHIFSFNNNHIHLSYHHTITSINPIISIISCHNIFYHSSIQHMNTRWIEQTDTNLIQSILTTHNQSFIILNY